MTTKISANQVLKQLRDSGDEKVRQRHVRSGAGDNVFGVLMGQIRALAQALGVNHSLGLELWASGNYEARILACSVLDPQTLTATEAKRLLDSLSSPMLVDEFVWRVLVKAPVSEVLRVRWMNSKDELTRRAGWKLLAGHIASGKANADEVKAWLVRIERELPEAPYRVKEGINHSLVWIGLHLPEHRREAIAIGKRLGRWDPRPIPKGCTSSYAPEWIAAALALKKGEKTAARKAMDAKRARPADRGR